MTNPLTNNLLQILTNNFSLYITTLNFHWNVVDSNFYSLHKFFEEQYKVLAQQNDDIAERIRQLGEKVPASLAYFSENATLTHPSENVNSEGMLKNLTFLYEAHNHNIHKTLIQRDIECDMVTSDLLVKILEKNEKTLWMIKSHLTDN